MLNWRGRRQGRSLSKLKNLKNLATGPTRPAPPEGGAANLKGCAPCRRPPKGNRWLVIGGRLYRIGGCLDHLSVSLLDLGGTLGSSGGPSDHMVSAFVVRGCFFYDFRDLFRRPGKSFSHSNGDLDAAIAIQFQNVSDLV